MKIGQLKFNQPQENHQLLSAKHWMQERHQHPHEYVQRLGVHGIWYQRHCKRPCSCKSDRTESSSPPPGLHGIWVDHLFQCYLTFFTSWVTILINLDLKNALSCFRTMLVFRPEWFLRSVIGKELANSGPLQVLPLGQFPSWLDTSGEHFNRPIRSEWYVWIGHINKDGTSMHDTSCYFTLWSDLLLQGLWNNSTRVSWQAKFALVHRILDANQKVLPLCSSVTHFPICFSICKSAGQMPEVCISCTCMVLKTSSFSNPVFEDVTLVALGMCGFPSMTEFFPPPTLPQSSKETGATGWWLACCMTCCCVESVQVREVSWG